MFEKNIFIVILSVVICPLTIVKLNRGVMLTRTETEGKPRSQAEDEKKNASGSRSKVKFKRIAQIPN